MNLKFYVSRIRKFRRHTMEYTESDSTEHACVYQEAPLIESLKLEDGTFQLPTTSFNLSQNISILILS